MFKRAINHTLVLPLALCINSISILSSETNDYIDNVLEEKANQTFLSYQDIDTKVITKMMV